MTPALSPPSVAAVVQSAKEEIMNRLVRIVPLAGVVYFVLEVAGNGSIGSFPDSDTAIAKLVPFYATHHAGIARGGFLLHYAALALGLFLVAVWARARRAGVHALVSGTLLVGAAVTVAAAFAEAGVYSTLGFVGAHESVIAPAALQAWHVNGAGGGATTGDGGLMIVLLAISAAAIAGRALPRWLGWIALPLGLVQLTPLGFFGGLVFWAWAAIAGVYMAARPLRDIPAATKQSPAFAR
jgi:hypothetical protein